MSWQDEGTTLLRVFVNDTDAANRRFSDDSLEQTLAVAARLVLARLDFSQPYAVDVVNVAIAPDPAAAATRDENFVNLMAVRAACILDRGAATAAADQAIRVKDGASEVDLRAVFKAKLDLLKQGWCAVFEEMADQYVTGQTGQVVGAAIVGPFRLFSGYGGDMPFMTLYDPRASR